MLGKLFLAAAGLALLLSTPALFAAHGPRAQTALRAGPAAVCPNPDCPNADCPNPDCPNPDCPQAGSPNDNGNKTGDQDGSGPARDGSCRN